MPSGPYNMAYWLVPHQIRAWPGARTLFSSSRSENSTHTFGVERRESRISASIHFRKIRQRKLKERNGWRNFHSPKWLNAFFCWGIKRRRYWRTDSFFDVFCLEAPKSAVGQIKQEPRRRYWAIRWLNALLDSLARSAALTRSLARSLCSLPRSWESDWLHGYFVCVSYFRP